MQYEMLASRLYERTLGCRFPQHASCCRRGRLKEAVLGGFSGQGMDPGWAGVQAHRAGPFAHILPTIAARFAFCACRFWF